MLTSSPPFGPFSICQIAPVIGCFAIRRNVRWPIVKISGLASARPTNGLSGGTLPSSVSRRILPPSVLGDCVSPPPCAAPRHDRLVRQEQQGRGRERRGRRQDFRRAAWCS